MSVQLVGAMINKSQTCLVITGGVPPPIFNRSWVPPERPTGGASQSAIGDAARSLPFSLRSRKSKWTLDEDPLRGMLRTPFPPAEFLGNDLARTIFLNRIVGQLIDILLTGVHSTITY